MELKITKKGYIKHIKLLMQIFYAPNFIIKLIIKFFIKKEQNGYTLRLVSRFYKKSQLFLKFQIINTRATFDIEITFLLMSKTILAQIDPFHLFEIGSIYKDNHSILSKSFKKNSKYDFVLVRLFKKIFSGYTKYHKIYPMRIENYRMINDMIFLSLRVLSTSLLFKIPLSELVKDFTLLSNIEPSDIISIGYSIREDEIENNKIAII